jgi:P-type conjugative transfer protein TrbJ
MKDYSSSCEAAAPLKDARKTTRKEKSMLRKVLTRLTLCASALAATPPLALGVWPVYDAPNHATGIAQLQQQVTSATQNVASVLKQVDQYALQMQQYRQQLMQYAQQLKDAALPVSQVWSQAQKTMGDMMNLVNQSQNAQMLSYIQQYRDLNGWLQSNGNYNPNTLQQGYALQKSTNDTALQLAQAQRQALLNDAQTFQGLQSAAGSADGADKLMSYANQIAAQETQQLMQLRTLINQLLEENAARDAALANRQAQMDAATQQGLAREDGGFEGAKALPLNYENGIK